MSSISAHSKKVLNNLLENFAESNRQLQNLLHDFITQVSTNAREWMDDPSDKNLTFKEAVAMVSAANMTLAEHIDMISDQVHNPLLTTEKTKSLKKQAQSQHDSRVKLQVSKEEVHLTSRLDKIEANFSSLCKSKQLMEEEILKIKQWRDKLEAEVGLNIDKLSTNQEHNFKNIGKQLMEQDKRMKYLNEEIEYMKEKESSSNKQIEKISLDLQNNEKIFLKIDQCLEIYGDKVENVIKEVKQHSELIATLQENEKATSALSTKALEKINLKLGTNEEVSTKTEFYEYCQLNGLKIGFKASQGSRQLDIDNYPSIYFENVECDIETLFDKVTGRFIVPIDGAYTISLSTDGVAACRMASNVYRRSQGMTTPQSVCISSSPGTKTCVLWLKSGDELWACVTLRALKRCTFSCFLNDF